MSLMRYMLLQQHRSNLVWHGNFSFIKDAKEAAEIQRASGRTSKSPKEKALVWEYADYNLVPFQTDGEAWAVWDSTCTSHWIILGVYGSKTYYAEREQILMQSRIHNLVNELRDQFDATK